MNENNLIREPILKHLRDAERQFDAAIRALRTPEEAEQHAAAEAEAALRENPFYQLGQISAAWSSAVESMALAYRAGVDAFQKENP